MSDKSKRTLTESDVSTKRGLSRRSLLLGAFGGATALSACVPSDGGVVVVGGGVTDADSGNRTDAAGYGRGGYRGYTGITDSDNGNIVDAAGYGRG